MTGQVTIELSIEEPLWAALDLSVLAQRACQAAATVLRLAVPCDVSILAANDGRIASLNEEFRGKAVPTNVLSWPSEDLAGPPGELPKLPTDLEIGDIALAYETCAREAAEFGRTMQNHVTHLIVHGFLHLLGYDHENDEDATVMEGLEIQALETLGIENPY